ncbi:bifunctional lysylphosphatidylglycerol flippase/synthetase MprF [Microbacterium sp. NPDC089698]|uniref:bifunctional lysylphosphatidylglycerol flippase/synthetase MprF n=1 Tax=Microbacterium sp. NPDC089698 TaxID=3364200 RepID=UPI0037F27EAB
MTASEPAPSAATVTPDLPPAAKKTGAFAAYLRANPFSVVLALIVLGTGLGFGTFWGEFPTELAAGSQSTWEWGGWWTPATALLIPDSLIAAVLAILLALTAGAYAERRLGTVRAMIAFFATGVVAVLLGLGVQAVMNAWGTIWALMKSDEFVADPSIGIIGMLMSATALAPALWQRRIRVIGFTVLVMFVLYAGDMDSVFRLIAAVLGLLLGLLLARGAARGSWHRSSYREVRTLVAAIVAATGLGPFIVLISGNYDAPLSLVLSGFVADTSNGIDASCGENFTSACANQASAILTAGAGPLLVSLVPFLLALLAAWGLRTGRRAAWILALVAKAGTAIGTAIALSPGDLLDAKARAEVGVEFMVLVLLAVALPLAVIVLLLVTRRRFRVAAPRRAAGQFAVTVIGAWLVLTAAYFAIALARPQDYLGEHVSFGALFADVLLPSVPAGFLPNVTEDAIPMDGPSLLAYQWIGVAFWLVFTVAMIRLYRATRLQRAATEEAQFRSLLQAGGGGTLGFMGTWPGNAYWFTPDGRGAVAYRVIKGVALTMSDPVCAEGAERVTIEGFVAHCEAQGWSACFYSFHEKYLPIFQSFGWQHMSVGEETVLDLPGLELAGKAWQKVRQPLNRGQREGITTLWSTWHDLPAQYTAEIEAVSEEWVANKKLPEMGFTLGGMDELKDPDVGIFLAINKDGGIEATTSWLPSWTDGRITGWTIDFMRRGDGSMPGIMEFVIASAALHMKEQGAEVMSLSGAPLATKPGEEPGDPTVMSRLLEWLGRMLEPAYGFTSLFRFKSKFNPRYETIHMAYADPAQLANIGLAIGEAYLPHATPKEYLALVQTITGRGGDH